MYVMHVCLFVYVCVFMCELLCHASLCHMHTYLLLTLCRSCQVSNSNQLTLNGSNTADQTLNLVRYLNRSLNVATVAGQRFKCSSEVHDNNFQ